MDLDIRNPSGSYNIKSGEIFLTLTGEITIHCSLCERKYNDFSDFSYHVGVDHLPIFKVDLFSDSVTCDTEIQHDGISLDSCPNDDDNYQLRDEFDNETFEHTKDFATENTPNCVEEVKADKKSGSRAVRKRVPHEYDETTCLYHCTICEFACKLYKNLVGHMKRHSDNKPYQCSECEKAFYTRFELKTHLRSHTGERPFLCNECGQSFITSGKLADHRKRHTNEKNYRCELCKRRFFNSQNLRKHLLVHSEERSYKCKVCNASFKRLTALSNHRKLHENKKEFQCELCPARFNQRPGLYSHLKSKHSLPNISSSSTIIEEAIEVEF